MWALLRFMSVLTAAAVMTSLVSQLTLVTASVCPLDLSWSNFTSVASACSDPNEVAKCCRYINALIAVSVARYASMTGQLGVPNTFSETCINSVSETLELHGVSSKLIMFCGLGTKILVNYQCRGRKTSLEMLQSTNFTDVMINCKMPFSLDSVCRRCINSEISYLHHLLGTKDSVTLSTCRNAVFVTLTNHGDQASAIDLAKCLFGIEYLGILPVNISGSPPLLSPNGSPSPLLAESPSYHLIGMSAKEHHHSYKLTLIQRIGIGVIGGAVLLLIILILLIHSKNKELKDVVGPAETSARMLLRSGWRCQEGPPSIFKMYSYKETKKATCNFRSILGKGGFGTVYRAQFNDGLVAAVKRMDKIPQQGKDDFCREIELLGRLHHRHLVALKGFCVDKHERFLVYEYMENGSLKDHIHSPGKTPLSWETRMQIAIDVANALEYLHFYCDPPLCHRDIKSSNILLDENFVAKVADFGLAHVSRSSSVNFEPVNTNISGTPGYVDPEYVVTHELTEKSDIYSYGVLLLELITGRSAIQDNRNLVEWSRKFVGIDSQLADMVDPRIADSLDPEQLHVIVRIIQWCTQGEGRDRPSIKHILRMLHEGLDPAQCRLNFEDPEGGSFSGLDLYKDGLRPSMASGDARCFMSSSSTSRSYCSRSFLLESGSPQSGHLSS